MFTGIVECIGIVEHLKNEKGNLHIEISCSFLHELKIDQSVAHNGVCLTVVDIKTNSYTVTAIKETLDKTNLANLKKGDEINLERCMKLGDRLDGHIVQGHVDKTGVCVGIEDQKGSTMFTFEYDGEEITVEKGSVTVNGVSLTVVNSSNHQFSVCIIPYTLENTNLKNIQLSDIVNIEFDIVGKYIAKIARSN